MHSRQKSGLPIDFNSFDAGDFMQVRCHLKKAQEDCPKGFEAFAKERAKKLQKLPFKITKVDVTLSKVGGFFQVDLVLKGAKIVRSEASTSSFEESLDRCLEKCIRQIKKLKSTHRIEQRRERRKKRRDHQLMQSSLNPKAKKAA